jgi:zinc transporter ZupT
VQGILSLFNVGTGAVFLTVGIVHLLPEVMEFQAAADFDTEFPVGLSLVVVGFVLLLLVENVLFASHDHAPGDFHVQDQVVVTEKTNLLSTLHKDIMDRYRPPMIMQLAIMVHNILESITLGLAVRLFVPLLADHSGVYWKASVAL